MARITKENLCYQRGYPYRKNIDKTIIKFQDRSCLNIVIVMIPKFSDMFVPFLEFIKDGNLYKISDLINHLSVQFSISEEERNILAPSKSGKLFDNRVRWCRLELKVDNLIESPQRGFVRITDKGLELLKSGQELTVAFLRKSMKSDLSSNGVSTISEDQDLDQDLEQAPAVEIIGNILLDHNERLKASILNQLLSLEPDGFEQIILDILFKMGYGNNTIHTGKTGDHGIDGIINQDRLGIDKLYIQAKRWEKDVTIGEPEIRQFSGALDGQKTKKGLFITTAKFSSPAREFALRSEKSIILIDGLQLAGFMLEYEIGLKKIDQFNLYEVDEDFFDYYFYYS